MALLQDKIAERQDPRTLSTIKAVSPSAVWRLAKISIFPQMEEGIPRYPNAPTSVDRPRIRAFQEQTHHA